METAHIRDSIRQGPNERLIFERDVPAPKIIAELIASLANTHGGTIVFGLSDQKRIAGVRNTEQVLTTITRGTQLVTPPLLVEPCIVTLDGATLIAVDVPQGTNTPYIGPDGRVLVRSRTGSVAATPQQASELARRAFAGAMLIPLADQESTRRLQAKNAPQIDLEHILLKLEHLIIANAELTRRLDQANSWRSRLLDQIMGAALGLIVSVILFYLGLN